VTRSDNVKVYELSDVSDAEMWLLPSLAKCCC